MEKIKEFMSNPKKTAILGLVGAIPMIIYALYCWFDDFEFSFIFSILYLIAYNIGLVIYFTIVLNRLYKHNGNIKIANYVLIAGYIVSLASNLIELFPPIFSFSRLAFCICIDYTNYYTAIILF